MKEKNKNKMKKNHNFKGKSEMGELLSDSRFANVPFDPKLRHMPKKDRKVTLDSRFSSLFTDEKFYEKSTMDPRGRLGNFSTKEDLRKFYHMSSDEEESDDDRKEEIEDNENDINTKGSSVDEEESKEQENDTTEDNWNFDNVKEREDIAPEIDQRLQDMTQDYARGTVLFSDDSSDDDSSSSDEEKDEGEFEWGELDQDAVWDTEQEVEETSRIAVCNLDWNHIKAVDIMVVFNSFCPRGGSINKVTIYPSEFGKERMAEEEKSGPKELLSDSTNQRSFREYDDDVDLDNLEKGKLNFRGRRKEKYEDLRRYERNRLRYYYAVVECDSVDTAIVLYKECDRQSFERAGILMDLRYIPVDMTFDDTPHDESVEVPEFYEAKLFTTTALFDSQPTLTWDQTDPHRQKILSRAMEAAISGNDISQNVNNFIASSDESEDDDVVEEEDFSSDDEEDTKVNRIAKFRALIQEIDDKEKKKSNQFNMEQVFGEKDEEEGDDSDDEEKTDKKSLNPFERYLEKRITKKKEREKEKASKKEESSEEESESESSDDDIPDYIAQDPFFAEELNKRKEDKNKNKKKPRKEDKDKNKPKKKHLKKEENEDVDQGDLELLVMDDEKHFNMRDIIADHKDKSKKKVKKWAKQKMIEKMKARESLVDDFMVDTKDPRFSSLLTSGEYNIDPSHPQFKRTKAMDNLIGDVQKKRVAESFEITPDSKRIKTNKGREELELSMLVKKVKSKTKKVK